MRSTYWFAVGRSRVEEACFGKVKLNGNIYGAGLLYQITETATATNTLTYHFDYRGSTIALSADNGLVTDRIEYSAYGLTTYRNGTNDTPFLFNGRYGVQTDPNGLLYMRARYYNPYLCRFISADPSGFGGGLNHFAYANGNPVSLIDPFGLNGESTGDSSFYWTGTSQNSVPNITTTLYPNVNTGPQMGPVGFTPAAPYYDPNLPTSISINQSGEQAFQPNQTSLYGGTFQIGLTLNWQGGPLNLTGSSGLVFDSNGHFGTYYTGGGGGGVGAGLSGGLTFATSNGGNINDLAGPFAYGSGTLGAILSGSVDGFGGPGSHGQPIIGGGFTIGIGAGGGAATGGTGTSVHQIW